MLRYDKENNQLQEKNTQGEFETLRFRDYTSFCAKLEGLYKLNVARIGEIQSEVKQDNRPMMTIEKQEINNCMNDCNIIVDYLRLSGIEFEFDDYGCIKIKNRQL